MLVEVHSFSLNVEKLCGFVGCNFTDFVLLKHQDQCEKFINQLKNLVQGEVYCGHDSNVSFKGIRNDGFLGWTWLQSYSMIICNHGNGA